MKENNELNSAPTGLRKQLHHKVYKEIFMLEPVVNIDGNEYVKKGDVQTLLKELIERGEFDSLLTPPVSSGEESIKGYWATCKGCGAIVAGMSGSHLTSKEIFDNLREWAEDNYTANCSTDPNWSVTLGMCSCSASPPNGVTEGRCAWFHQTGLACGKRIELSTETGGEG